MEVLDLKKKLVLKLFSDKKQENYVGASHIQNYL